MIEILPPNWKFKKLKHISTISTGQTPPREVSSYFSDEKSGNYLWIKPENLNSPDLITNTKEYITPLGLQFIKKYNPSTIILSGIGAGVGNIGLSKYPFTTNQQNHIIYKCLNHKYIYYYLIAKKEQIVDMSVGNVLPILNATKLKNFVVHYPPMLQQTAIANFLDHQTSKIDKEISLLEKKVELLDELKQSTIYEAVTKGLNPDVKMKDSGIEWIGMIPEHWEIKRVKDVSQISKGKANEMYEQKENTNLPCIDTNFLRNKLESITFNNKGLKVKPNDILILWDGANAGELFKNTELGFLGSTFAVFKTKINKKFFYHYLKGIEKKTRSNLTGMGIPHVNGTILKQIPFLIPSEIEQIKINEYIDNKLFELDNKIILINKKNELLKEFKQSLIYEAVTGKIKIGK